MGSLLDNCTLKWLSSRRVCVEGGLRHGKYETEISFWGIVKRRERVRVLVRKT